MPVQPVGQPVRPGSPGGANMRLSAARLSCETIMDRIAAARAQPPVQRSVVRSETSSRSGFQVVRAAAAAAAA